MNEAEFRSGVRKAWFFTKAVGVDSEFSVPVSLVASDEFKQLCVDREISYDQLFLAGIRGGQYNILLADYSFFQFTFRSEHDVRYAYYPNPFLGASREAISTVAAMHEYVAEGVVDLDEFLQKISEIRQAQHPPLVRYEYARSQYVHLKHPSSHLHLGLHGDSRWAVRRVLTPGAFALLVLKLFYGEYWAEAALLRLRENPTTVDEELTLEKYDCRILPEEEFSRTEESHFYWG